MAELRNVRFKLSQLAAAVAELTGEAPSAKAALEYYWNWATNRGWSLVATAMHMDTSTAVLVKIQNGMQFELRHEEFWNVVWRGEDAAKGPDMLSEDE